MIVSHPGSAYLPVTVQFAAAFPGSVGFRLLCDAKPQPRAKAWQTARPSSTLLVPVAGVVRLYSGLAGVWG